MDQSEQFDEWINVKKKLHYKSRTPHINEGEIWWVAIGKNVGVEINGKSQYFSRPVVVFKKLSRLGFMGIPLSTQSMVALGTQIFNSRIRLSMRRYLKQK